MSCLRQWPLTGLEQLSRIRNMASEIKEPDILFYFNELQFKLKNYTSTHLSH